jgi:hypothetical protein
VRHSTPDVRDARNGLALRYGVPTVLLEGRKAVRGDSQAERARLREALQAALDVVVRWAEENQELLTAPPPPPGPGAAVAIRCRHRRADGPCVMPLQDARSGVIQEREVPGTFYPGIEVTRWVRLPEAYAIPQSHAALIAVLQSHGLPNRPAGPDTVETVERYWLRSRQRGDGRAGRARRVSVETVRERRLLSGHVLFPVTADGGFALAVHLEPQSKYGLHRVAELNLLLRPEAWYPVLRVVSTC